MKKVTEKPDGNDTPQERLKNLRKERGLSQADLAEEIGKMQHGKRTCSEKQISFIESGSRPISRNYAHLFSEYFGVTEKYILGESIYRTEADEITALQREYSDQSDAVFNGLLALMDSSLREVCARENIPVPTLSDVGELLFLQAQIKDYSDSLMWNYVKWKNNSHVWSLLSQFEEARKRREQNDRE